MQILHTNAAYAPFVGGAETYLKAISERLASDGHSVTVATTDATNVQSFWDPHQPRVPDREEAMHGVRVVRDRVEHLPLSPWSFYVLRRLVTDLSRLQLDTRTCLERLAPLMPWVPKMSRTLEELPDRFDLVHGVNISLEWPLLAGWRYARRHGLPFVATPFVHVGDWSVQRFYTMPHQLVALCDADLVIVQTDIEAGELVRLGVPESRILRLGMGVDLDQVQSGDGGRFRAQHAIDGPAVTFMGAVTDDKGAVHLLRAMQHLWRNGSKASLIIAGKTVTPGTFERVFGELPEAHRMRVRRLGQVSGQLKQDMLAATDLFVLPSRVDSFGIVYLEAWAYGVPVIGCQAGGVPEVIEEGHDGLLVPFGDEGSLATAIETLLGDPDCRQTMGEQGRAKVKAHYTWDRIYHKLLAAYEELVDSSRRARGDGES